MLGVSFAVSCATQGIMLFSASVGGIPVVVV